MKRIVLLLSLLTLLLASCKKDTVKPVPPHLVYQVHIEALDSNSILVTRISKGTNWLRVWYSYGYITAMTATIPDTTTSYILRGFKPWGGQIMGLQAQGSKDGNWISNVITPWGNGSYNTIPFTNYPHYYDNL